MRERELKRADSLQVARLAEVGLSSAALLHEMRQPLTAIKLALQMARGERFSPHLEEALAQVERLAGLLHRAHTFMEPGAEVAAEFELEPVVQRALGLLEHSLRRQSIELVVDVRARPVVRAAPQLVEQILFNLINNARDSLVENGSGGRLAVIVREERGAAEVIVADDGIGIPSSHRTAIFAAYTTTKGAAGCGLGLYIARRLALSFGGRLTVMEPGPTQQLLQPPPATALVLRIPLGKAAGADAARRGAGAGAGSVDETIIRLEELRRRQPRVAVLCSERWIQELLARFLQPVACSVLSLTLPQPLTIDEAELLLLVPTGMVSVEETMRILTRGAIAPAVIAVLPQWNPDEAVSALRLGCVEAIKAPTSNLELLTAQAAVLGALEDRRNAYEAELLLQAWVRTQHGEVVREVLAEQQERASQEICVCGRAPLCQLVGGVFGGCREVAQQAAEECVADLLFVEPEGMSLSLLLERLLVDASHIVICAERLSLREVQHALSRGAFRLVTEIDSAPLLARERIEQLRRRLETQQRLVRAIHRLIRRPLAERTATHTARQRRVLVVDDERVILKILEAALQPTGCEVLSCATGQQAMQALQRQPVDLLIADKNLPDISGIDVARAGRALFPELPVLIITGFPSQPSAEEAMQLRVDDYLVKPFDLEDLVARASRLLARPAARERPAQVGERLRAVVLADPDDATRARLAEVFAARGDEILGAGAPSVALHALRHRPAGIVVLDVDRPLGAEEQVLLAEARQAAPTMVVIATATHPNLARTLVALRLGACELLHKPLGDVATVLAAVNRACSEPPA